MNNGSEMVGKELFVIDLEFGARKRKLYTNLNTTGFPA
jgi:hypothetical protein